MYPYLANDGIVILDDFPFAFLSRHVENSLQCSFCKAKIKGRRRRLARKWTMHQCHWERGLWMIAI